MHIPTIEPLILGHRYRASQHGHLPLTNHSARIGIRHTERLVSYSLILRIR